MEEAAGTLAAAALAATALATETFREAPAHEAAVRLVVVADPGAEALPVQVAHEVHQAWEAEVVVAVAASVVEDEAVVAAAAAEVVDGSAIDLDSRESFLSKAVRR